MRMAASKLHRLPLKLCVSGLSQQCAALGRHLRESPGDKARLQLASRSLLRGMTHLVELGEECVTEGQTSRVHSRRRLQAALCRRQVFFFRRAFQTKFSGNAGKIFTTGSAEEPLDGFQRGVQPFNRFQTANGPVFGPLFVCRCFNVQNYRPTDFFLNFSLLLFSHFSTAPLVSRQSRSSCGSWSLSWPLCKACSSAGPNRWGVTEMSGCGWRPEPGLCSTGRWSRKWPLRGGSRFVRLRVLNPCIEKREKSEVLVEKGGG